MKIHINFVHRTLHYPQVPIYPRLQTLAYKLNNHRSNNLPEGPKRCCSLKINGYWERGIATEIGKYFFVREQNVINGRVRTGNVSCVVFPKRHFVCHTRNGTRSPTVYTLPAENSHRSACVSGRILLG